MKKQNEKIDCSVHRSAYTTRAFTLVELIVVITILAILGTIAFISLQGYSSQARDSKRLSDIQNIKKSLELFSLNTGKYPEPDSKLTISYGDQELRYQGTVGEQVAVNLSRNLNEKPTDPLTENEYTYSRTYAGNEYELLSIYESVLVSQNNNLLNQTNAANANYPKINGNYNGVYVKAGIYYIPTPSIINALNTDLDLETQTDGLLSQIITGGDNNIANAGFEATTGGLSGMTVEVFTGELDTDIGEDDNNNKEELAQAFIDAYSGTILANAGVYKNIVETRSEDFVSLVDNFVLNKDNFVNTTSISDGGGDTTPTVLITQSECEDEAGWIWVTNDVYIGSTPGDGFCISPIFGDWGDTNDGTDGISFNGWGNDTNTYYQGWNSTSIDDSGNSSPQYGQTKLLEGADASSNVATYGCKTLGTASSDYDTSDTIIGRMKWLATTGNSYTESQSIDWITGINPVNGHAVPALFVADCIDGVKDLGTTMSYTDIADTEINTSTTNSSATDNVITYNEYSTDVTLNTDTAYLSDTTYQNRQKYLTAWTQKSGSHLPSAFSYITSGKASANDDDGDFLTGNSRGEYQVACDAGLFGAVTDAGTQYTGSSDDINNERIWTSAIGYTTGIGWGRSARIVGYHGCGDQHDGYTGYRPGNLSARFVVRP